MFFIGKSEDYDMQKIFNYLYEIYQRTNNSRNSILSNEIELFKTAFENLCSSLKGAGVDLGSFKKIKNVQTSKFSNTEQKPRPISFLKQPEESWSTSNDSNYDINIIYQNDRNEKKEEEKKHEKKVPELPKIDIPKYKKEEVDSDKEREEEDEGKEQIHLKKTEDIVEVKNEEINKLKSMSDEDVTKGIVKIMLSKNPESNIKLSETFPEFYSESYGNRNNILTKSINEQKESTGINKPLYQLINNFSKNLYIKLFQQCSNIDRKELCCVIAIDLCRTINKKFKLLHTLISTAMAHCFNSIEVPYSIVVFCDYDVQFIIKDFNEPHQDDIGQLIFDAIMTPRFFTRISDACYFISKKVNCEGRDNKRIFLISNGLDPKLKIGEKWGPIFKNPKEKFCFYFIKSEISESDQNNILQIWKDFQRKTKVELAIFSQEDILSESPSSYEPFGTIMRKELHKIEEKNKKSILMQPDYKEIIQFDKDKFIKLLNSINNDNINDKDYFVQNMAHIPSKNKYKLENIKLKNPFMSFKSDCSDENYDSEKMNRDTKFALDKLFNSKNSTETKLEYMEFIFIPNKPSMYSPSTKGTRLYLIGLINFIITRGQDNKIWLEKNKGLKKDYRVSIIIDSSISCFNEYNRPLSVKAVLVILRLLSLIEIPFLDIIISTPKDPIVLSCGNDTTNSLNSKSNLWVNILAQLTHNEEGCNLLSALQLVYKLKSMNNTKKYYTFILTDGMFDKDESEQIQDYISFLEESYIDVFGIGLGYYPEGIKRLFSKCVWSLNPFMILKAISAFFGSNEKHLENLPQFKLDSDINSVYDDLTKIIDSLNSYQQYKNLYGFLEHLPFSTESYDEIANPDKADQTQNYNPEIKDNNTMYKRGQFEGFKILIGMFWSHVLSENESEWIDKKYLLERFDKKKECLREVLDYYSIEIVIKEDYKECIQELKTGIYYAHWVICGDGSGRLPNNGNANLVGQYIEALKIFWVNGGAIVFWNDNKPFTYECNLFLEAAEFPGEISKTKVRFGGEHKGKKKMIPGDITQELEKNSQFGKFNKKRIFNDGKYEIFSLGHNLNKIDEGTTISYVQNPEQIAPFIKFGIEHEGGINILFYTPHIKYNHGYLILEGGFTKLFNELEEDGTKRYILNIAGFTVQYQKRLAENCKGDFTLPPFEFNIDENVRYDIIKNSAINKNFDIVYLMDATGSMGDYLKAAKDQCINISKELRKILPKFDFQFGAIFYRDPKDKPGEKSPVFPLRKNVVLLKRDIEPERANGGGDDEEDWVNAYDMALNNIAWRNGTRLIIHIADAPAHGSQWCNVKKYEEENQKLLSLVQQCVDRNIKIIGFQIGNFPKKSFEKFQIEYLKRGGSLYKIEKFEEKLNANEISKKFKDMVVISASVAAPKEN